MKQHKYDIFISYRREGGAQYARTLQLMLEKKGYRVFLDYDELKDGEFSTKIIEAIKDAPIYIIVLSKGSMARCVNEGDWVRNEMELAVNEHKRIIPVNPDNTFDGVKKEVPESVRDAIESIQHSEISFGQALNATVDLMVKNRIEPYIPKRRRWIWYVVVLVVLMIAVIGFWRWKVNNDAKIALQEIEDLKSQTTFQNVPLSWSPEITKDQILTVREILNSMQPIDGGEFMQGAVADNTGKYDDTVEQEFETPAFKATVKPFYIGKFEVTVGQWNAIMGDIREGDPKAPIASVSFDDANNFIEQLCNLTLLQFRLPMESEWEYAAKGSSCPEGFLFAGSDNPDDVAWYAANSIGEAHSDLLSTPTVDDIFNMSGNVSEWCDTPFRPYDDNVPFSSEDAKVVRGGNFDSEPYELTVTHREPASTDTAIPTLGFRLAMDRTN